MVAGGQLSKVIPKLTESSCRDIMRGIFRALEYIHSNNIVHRDLKPGMIVIESTYFVENILLADSNDLSSIKVADFGLSSHQG